MKEEITESDQFFSKVSHDLRGSFTSILGFSDLLNDPSENLSSDEIKEFVKRIQIQARDSFELLVNFINWLKLEKYSSSLIKETVELYDILLIVQNDIKKELYEKNLTVENKLDASEFVVMDYEILRIILNNVFSFLYKVCCPNSKISVTVTKNMSDNINLEFFANCENKNSLFLQNINLKDLNNDLSFPLIFSLKLTELSGGRFNFSIKEQNDLTISLQLPK